MNRIISLLKRLYGNYLYIHFKRLYQKDPRLAAFALYDRINGNHDDFNIDTPNTLIEKITWLELHTDTSMWTLCADKYKMREYVKECGYEDNLPKLYGHWDNPDNIDFSQLPSSFVLKANNGSGSVMIVRNKGELNEKKVKKKLRRWISRPDGYMGAQKHYLSIKPCIIAEELLQQDKREKSFSSKSMVDYKIWCLNGNPECVLVIYNRSDEGFFTDLYDINWRRIPNALKKNSHYGEKKVKIPKPAIWDEMLEMASNLAKPFPQVRVDLYVSKMKPIVGELTFSTGYQGYTKDFLLFLGSKVDISEVKRID